jgi:hypothetical protein
MKHERDWLFCNAIRIPQAAVRCEDLKPSLRCVQYSSNARGGVESQLPEMAEGARIVVSQLAGCDTNNVKGWDSGKRGEAGWVAEGLWAGEMA